MKLKTLLEKIEYVDLDKDEIDYLKKFAEENDYDFSLDTPSMVQLIDHNYDDEETLYIDFNREKAYNKPGKFMYRIRTTVSGEDDEYPGPIDAGTVPFPIEDKMMALKSFIKRLAK